MVGGDFHFIKIGGLKVLHAADIVEIYKMAKRSAFAQIFIKQKFPLNEAGLLLMADRGGRADDSGCRQILHASVD